MTYSIFSKTRTYLMGIAALLIVLFHTSLKLPIILDQIKHAGDFGVNIFFLLSGMSMYYSWMKDPDTAHFLKKRLIRIFVPFFPVILLWCTPQLIIGRISITSFFLKIFSLHYWVDGNLLYWFVSVIIAFYLLTPLWMKCYSKSKCLTVMITCIIGMILIILDRNELLISHISGFNYRFLSYFSGLLIGDAAKRQINLTWKSYSLFAVSFLCGLAFFFLNDCSFFNYDYKYVIYILWTIPVTFAFACFTGWISKWFRMKFLVFCGSVTLEIYLFHEKIVIIFDSIINRLSIQLDPFNLTMNLFAFCITMLMAYVYHKICQSILLKTGLVS